MKKKRTFLSYRLSVLKLERFLKLAVLILRLLLLLGLLLELVHRA